MLRSSLSTVLCYSLALILLSACQSTITGNEGNLTFSYVADDHILDFNKPIAVGAYLDLNVRQAGSLLPVTLQSASIDDPEALTVVSTAGNQVTVQALAEGNVLLSVEAQQQNGEVVSDSVNLTTRIPDVLRLHHSCTDDTVGHYLINQTDLWLWFDMERENGQSVIGYGYFPVMVDPEASFVLDASRRDPQWMHFASGASPGTITLSSTIDDTTLTVELVDPGVIDGAELIGDYRAFVDVATLFYVRPTTSGTPICQAFTPVEVAVTSPDVCAVTILGDAPDETVGDAAQSRDQGRAEYSWIQVVGAEVGYCEFSMNFTAGNAGEGTAIPLTVEIIDIEEPEGDDTQDAGE